MGPSRRAFREVVVGRRHFGQLLSHLALATEAPSAAPRDAARTRQVQSRGKWAPAASTASPRSPARSSTPPTSVPTDLPGWPQTTSHAILVRAQRTPTHVYTGMDLARLERRAEAVGGGHRRRSRPDRHAGAGILCGRPVLPAWQDAALSGPAGRAVDLREVRRLRPGAPRRCATALFVKFGEETGPVDRARLRRLSASRAWAVPRRTRRMSIRRSRPAGSRPGRCRARRCRCGRALAKEMPAAIYAKAANYGEQIRAELAATTLSHLLVLDREFETQSVDPMFLEPEGGLAWYNSKAGKPRTGARRAVAL